MKTIINELTIKNFKSLKEIKIEQCKQVNVFIGKPNTGKSNILEAISLLSGNIDENKKFLEGSVYYEKINDLFNMQDNSNPISVVSNVGTIQLSYFPSDKKFVWFADNNGIDSLKNTLKFSSSNDAINNFVKEKKFAQEETQKSDTYEMMLADKYRGKITIREDSYSFCLINREGVIVNSDLIRFSPVRSYHYKRKAIHGNPESGYLIPPHGDNLLNVIRHSDKLQEVAGDFFKQYNFDLVLVQREEDANNEINIQRKLGAVHVQLPYTLAADTFQRMIFHLAAIYSNKDAVILFEEPEAHTYAPYQSFLVDEIIADEQNQYFITTHSNDIFDSLLREATEKVAVFIVGYEDSQTKVRQLSEEEISNYLTGYASIFQNLDGYSVL